MIIITVDSPQQEVLKKQTEEIRSNELALAREIAEQLHSALEPYFPAAGLAAPQIGISKSIFIFSYDRDPKNLEVVINPEFTPLGSPVSGWEACFSVILSKGIWKAAQVSRYEKIKVAYLNLQGERVEKILTGFAAKAFQHEYDHLQGVVNIYRQDAIVKTFDNKGELLDYLKKVKKEDAANYIKPEDTND